MRVACARPLAPTRHGLRRNGLPVISRWKILDNLRRSSVAPGTLLLLVAAWTVLPGQPLSWTLAVILSFCFPLAALVVEALEGPPPRQRLRTFLAHIALELTFLANDAFDMAHAIGVTLVRLVFTAAIARTEDQLRLDGQRVNHRLIPSLGTNHRRGVGDG